METQKSAQSFVDRFYKEFGWVGLFVTFLASDLGFSAFATLFKGALSGGDASLGSAITIITVFWHTLGLSLGVLVCTVIQLKIKVFHFPNTFALYALIMVVAATFAHAIGVGGNIQIPIEKNSFVLLSKILAVYASMYGIAVFSASFLIGIFFGRWAYSVMENA